MNTLHRILYIALVLALTLTSFLQFDTPIVKAFGENEPAGFFTSPPSNPRMIDINSQSLRGRPYQKSFVDLNGILYFNSYDGTHGLELWRSDGTSEGTWLVKDLLPRYSDGLLSDLTKFGEHIYFVGSDGTTEGFGLYKSDGTDVGTTRLKSLPTPPDYYFQVINPKVVCSNLLYFIHNDTLYRTDGTGDGTFILKDTATNPICFQNKVFFNSKASAGDANYQLWQSDGSLAGTQVFGSNVNPLEKEVVGAALFFTTYDSVNQNTDLHRTDGTTITPVKSFYSNDAGRVVLNELTAWNEQLFFIAYDDSSGSNLWKSNGSTDGTVIVKDMIPAASSDFLRNLTPAGAFLYFSANDGVHGEELWRTD